MRGISGRRIDFSYIFLNYFFKPPKVSRRVMECIKKILLTSSGEMYYVKDLTKDMHTEYGYITKEELQSLKSKVFSHSGNAFFMFEPLPVDVYGKIKRGAQIVPRKDIGLIIAETGLCKESRVVDAGAGSGALALFLAMVAREVTTYDVREDFIEIVKKNIAFLGLTNITVKHADIYNGVEETDVDAVTLDIPEPWKALPSCHRALRRGGFLVSYSPTIPQVMDFVEAVRQHEGFVYLKTSEIFEREWHIEARKVRPKSIGIGHSGFLSFARRV